MKFLLVNLILAVFSLQALANIDCETMLLTEHLSQRETKLVRKELNSLGFRIAPPNRGVSNNLGLGILVTREVNAIGKSEQNKIAVYQKGQVVLKQTTGKVTNRDLANFISDFLVENSDYLNQICRP
jgi:hypothetical protein